MFFIEGMDKVREVIEIDSGSPLEIQKLRSGLWKIVEGEGSGFVAGKGKHKPQLQQLYEELEECGERLMHYKGCFQIMGKGQR